MNLTDQQQEIIHSTEDNLVINAVAGSGKTTTLVQYALARPTMRILYLAYNKAISNEINTKLQELNITNVKASTIHSLAYGITGAHQYKFFELDELSIAKLIHTSPPVQRVLASD